MKQTKKPIAFLLVLALAVASAGCGNNEEQDAAEESAKTEEMEASASETVGNGADMNVDLDTAEAEISLKDALAFTAEKIETMGSCQTTIRLNVENTSEKDIRLTEWLSITLDGQKIPENSWSTGGSGFRIDAGCNLEDHITIDQSLSNCKEAILEANLKYSGSDDTEPVTIIISLEDIDKSTLSVWKTIRIKEQEL